jgi:broad specificity phosphatase PhoE
MAEQKWPQVLWIVRHGQSAGNVAREAAEAASEPLIDIAVRDVDTPLSELGRRQAAALGRWFGTMPRAHKPRVVLCSPYVRAIETTELLLDAAGVDAGTISQQRDERLREKEFGLLDRLTQLGIRP